MVYGNYYGTHRDTVAKIVSQNKICILDIDIKGLQDSLKNGLTGAFRIFITVPQIETLKKRLIERKTDKTEDISKRLNQASKEIDFAENANLYHYVIENKDLNEFLKKTEEVLENFYPFLNKNI